MIFISNKQRRVYIAFGIFTVIVVFFGGLTLAIMNDNPPWALAGFISAMVVGLIIKNFQDTETKPGLIKDLYERRDKVMKVIKEGEGDVYDCVEHFARLLRVEEWLWDDSAKETGKKLFRVIGEELLTVDCHIKQEEDCLDEMSTIPGKYTVGQYYDQRNMLNGLHQAKQELQNFYGFIERLFKQHGADIPQVQGALRYTFYAVFIDESSTKPVH